MLKSKKPENFFRIECLQGMAPISQHPETHKRKRQLVRSRLKEKIIMIFT